jgi:hypothetical protein
MSLRVNGKAYDWSDIDIALPGLDIQAQEISYDDELEKESVYGKGVAPRGYGTGNYKSEGKLTLLRDDYDQLVDYCKANNVALYRLVIPKVVVSYANEGERTRSDVLSTVTITKASHKGAQGDKSLTVELDLLIVNGIERDGLKAI